MHFEMVIADYQINAIHTFQIRTLRSLGFNSRVTLCNNSQIHPQFVTDYRIDLSVYRPSGTFDRFETGIARLPIGGKILIDCTPFSDTGADDQILIFHLIPERKLKDDPHAKTVAITR